MNDLSDMALATIARARRLAAARGSSIVETQDLMAALAPARPPTQPPSKYDGALFGDWDE